MAGKYNQLVKDINNFDIPQDWVKYEMGKIFDFYGGMSFSRNDLSKVGIPYLHYGDIHTSNKTYINISEELELLPRLDIELDKIKSGSLLNDGDIVFVDASEDYKGTSKCVVIENDKELPYISGLHTIIGKSKDDMLVRDYKKFCFENWDIKRQFAFYATGISVLGLNKTNLSKLIIPVPPIAEQEKIAKILSTQDEVIRLKEMLIEEKKKQKQYIMQTLFNYDSSEFKRIDGFNNEWKEIQLSKIFRERKTYSEKGLKFTHISLTKEGVVPKTERYERDFLVKEENKKYKITKLNDICYNPANLKFGVICKNTYGEGIFSPIYVTFEVNKEFDVDFVGHFVERWDFINRVRKYEEGTVYERMAVKPLDFLLLKIKLPTYEEQVQIAKILNDANVKIELLGDELKVEKQKKKALMQMLLTGKVRVKG